MRPIQNPTIHFGKFAEQQHHLARPDASDIWNRNQVNRIIRRNGAKFFKHTDRIGRMLQNIRAHDRLVSLGGNRQCLDRADRSHCDKGVLQISCSPLRVGLDRVNRQPAAGQKLAEHPSAQRRHPALAPRASSRTRCEIC